MCANLPSACRFLNYFFDHLDLAEVQDFCQVGSPAHQKRHPPALDVMSHLTDLASCPSCQGPQTGLTCSGVRDTASAADTPTAALAKL